MLVEHVQLEKLWLQGHSMPFHESRPTTKRPTPFNSPGLSTTAVHRSSSTCPVGVHCYRNTRENMLYIRFNPEWGAGENEFDEFLQLPTFRRSCIASWNDMAPISLASLFVALLSWLSLRSWATAQPCTNQSTAINGVAFPPLIEATTDDLVRGLEAGLFSSVDLVTVRRR